MPKGAFDVVTAQDPFWRGLFAWYVARRHSAKLNVQVHADLAAASVFRRTLARVVLRRADSIRVVSEGVKKQVQAMGITAPIHVLPVYINAERFRAVRHEPHPGKIILWVGRFEGEKDPLYALEVFCKVMQSQSDVRLIMLGQGSLEAKLKAQAQGLPVEFPGWQDPLPFLEQADAALSTSREESWGASVVEALAAGVPVVSPDVGVAREAGAIIAPKEQLAEAVAATLQSGARGALKLPLLSKEEWAQAWRNSLL